MAHRFWAGATALATSLAVMGSAVAAPASSCAKANEVTAIQAAAIQQQLMVAALTCNEVSNFNAFQTGYSAELRASDATLQKMFKRLYGAGRGTAEYHAFKTRLANESSIRSIHDNLAYCHTASDAFAAALVSARPSLATFVSAVQVTDDSPVASCDLRVATTLKPAAAATNMADASSVIVPKPNPMRVAMVTMPAPVVATLPQAAPTPAPAEPEKQPEEKKSGWLSGIFK